MQYRGNNFLYGGIDFSVPGEGGPACTHFLSPHRRLTESLLFGLLGLLVTVQAWRRVRLERNNNQESVGRGGESHHPGARQSLLVVLAVTFGLEVGFKLSTGQVIWLLNPCHVLTVVQLYLLASPSPLTSIAHSGKEPTSLAGGCYSGSVCCWDIRADSRPVSSTSFHHSHTQPVYKVGREIV